MLPTRIFRSRWTALLWAGGIVWTAYDVATSMPAAAPANASAAAAPRDALGDRIDPAALAALANVSPS